MAVLYRPIKNKHGERYNLVPYEVVDAEMYKDMPLDAAISSVLFFYRLEIALLITFLRYSQKEEMTNQPSTSKPSSPKSGAGIAQSIKLLEAISRSLTK